MKETIQQQTENLERNVGSTERVISVLTGAALTAYGARQRNLIGGLSAAAGSMLLFRGATGHCPLLARLGLNTAHATPRAVHIEESVTIDRTPDEVYTFWRDLETLPEFMRHLESVAVNEDSNRSHWTAKLPRDIGTLEWTAETTVDRSGEEVSWRSIPGSDIHTSGTVRFRPAPGQRGTELHASIDYRPPAGAIGRQAAAFLNRPIAQLIKEDIRRFKSFMEAGEIPTTEGQPSGRETSAVR